MATTRTEPPAPGTVWDRLARANAHLRETLDRAKAPERPKLTLIQGGGEVDPPSTAKLIEAMNARGLLSDQPAVQRLLAWREQEGRDDAS